MKNKNVDEKKESNEIYRVLLLQLLLMVPIFVLNYKMIVCNNKNAMKYYYSCEVLHS